jgi:RNA-directed DNA polymerase
MLEEILDRRNIEKALVQVETNKGAAGIDAMQWNELRSYINTQWQALRQSILEGSYEPSPVRKVEIPKPQGGKRMLGIPTVVDRMLQQAIAQWLTPMYEPEFSKRSYGFRPNRNAHQAVLQAEQYLNEGKIWVIELDLENFFDKVNHDRLMNKLSRRVTDKRTLKLIRSYLTSGIMEGGVISTRSEGTPQGSPLSPLLSNIALDELDKELEKRRHNFVRYADDVSVYLSSESAAERVMSTMTKFIERKLRLKVNREKTKVSKPRKSRLLGFSFSLYKGKWIIHIARRSVERIKKKFKAMTLRSKSMSEGERIAKLNTVIRGWVNYFVIAKAKSRMQHLDGNLRTRLRMCKWKQWKTTQTRRANLLKLGASLGDAHNHGGSSAGYCRVAQSFILCKTLTDAYFRKQGYVGFFDLYQRRTEKQTSLF